MRPRLCVFWAPINVELQLRCLYTIHCMGDQQTGMKYETVTDLRQWVTIQKDMMIGKSL